MNFVRVYKISKQFEKSTRTWKLKIKVYTNQRLGLQIFYEVSWDRFRYLLQAKWSRDWNQLRHLTEKVSCWLINVFEFASDQECSHAQAFNMGVIYDISYYDEIDDVHGNMKRLLLQTLDGIVHLRDPVNQVSSV